MGEENVKLLLNRYNISDIHNESVLEVQYYNITPTVNDTFKCFALKIW